MQKVATKGIHEPQDEREFNEQHFEACRKEKTWQGGPGWEWREKEEARHCEEAAQGPAALLAMLFCGASMDCSALNYAAASLSHSLAFPLCAATATESAANWAH